MPCTVEPGAYGDDSRRRLEEVTQLLCSTCRAYSSGIPWNELITINPDIGNWYADHLAWDARREAQEAEARRIDALRDAARAKLTPEERRLLCLE